MRDPDACRPARGAFTLLELLIVLAIVAILLGLLASGVQRARGAANRLACGNNLKQLGLAVQAYHDTNGSLPPAAVSKPQPHAWAPFLLPYLEQEPLARAYAWGSSWRDPVNQPVVTTPLPLLRCPATPVGRVESGTTAGQPWSAAPGDYVPVRSVNSDLVDEGLIARPASRRGALGVNERRGLGSITDGTSSTLLLVEDAGRPQRWQAGRLLPGATSARGGWADPRAPIRLDGYDRSDGTLVGPCAVNGTNDGEVYAFHPSGANGLLADGAVRFLSAGMSIRTLAALVTRAGGEVVSSSDY